MGRLPLEITARASLLSSRITPYVQAPGKKTLTGPKFVLLLAVSSPVRRLQHGGLAGSPQRDVPEQAPKRISGPVKLLVRGVTLA